MANGTASRCQARWLKPQCSQSRKWPSSSSYCFRKRAQAVTLHFSRCQGQRSIGTIRFHLGRDLILLQVKILYATNRRAKESRLLPSSRRRGVRHESATFSEVCVPQLQGRPSQGCRAHHLQGPTSQAAPGLIPWQVRHPLILERVE